MRVRISAVFVLLAINLIGVQGLASAAPVNDDFADAIVIPSGGGDFVGQAGGATRQTGEPNHAGISGATSVWFRWTPTQANLAGHVELFNSSDAIAVAVYTGSSVSTLKEIGNSSSCTPNITAGGPGVGAGPCVWFTASSDTTYRIAVVPSSDPTSAFSLSVGGEPCSIRGTEGNDLLEVTSALDVVCGFGGNDAIFADGPIDDLGDQDQRQEDVILGGAGKDTLNYSGAPSAVLVLVGRGVTTMPGLTADHREIFAEIGDVVGSPFADRLDGNANTNTLTGGRGTDRLNGGAGADLLRGGNGVDTLAGNEGDDALYGGPSNDRLYPGAGDDVLWGETGTDGVSYKGAPSGITLDLATRAASGWGADVLNGIEIAYGSSFADVLRGSTAQNMLFGRGGADTLRTNDGIAGDTADGGPGTDACTTDSGDVRISCP
jgi:Ca2+-binding RTX toxin-like protein